MTTLVLTGFMGTGKTSVGRLLARRYGLPFFDMDQEIERCVGRTVADIFAADGEAAFRRMERDVLQRLPDGAIVATGGGSLVSAENRDLLRPDHRVVCLTCDPGELASRIERSDGRPLVGSWRHLLRERAKEYARFDQVDTTGRTPDQVAVQIAGTLELETVGRLSFRREGETRVVCERGALDTFMASEMGRGASGALVVTDELVAQLGIADRVLDAIRCAGVDATSEVLPAGEETKSLIYLDRLYERCRLAGLDRESLVIGVGGGVIGDLTGLLAATYMRGIGLVLAPTTLLAQVDASIGGKVGIDAHGTKNLVGAFYPAQTVVIDPTVLASLPVTRLSEGLAEIVKIAAMRSPSLLASVSRLERPEDVVDHPEIVRCAVVEKMAIVESDPFECGERALLNFGHTVGHAIEAASHFRLSHGEAVAIGMVAETWLGERLSVTEPGTLDCLSDLISRFQLPLSTEGVDPVAAFQAMLGDKKRRHGALRVAIPRRAGAGTIVTVSDEDGRRALSYALGVPE